MKIRASTLDDLLHEVLERLIKRGHLVTASKGDALEVLGVVLELANPRARLSYSEERHILFSCLGELLWYLSGSDSFSFINYYVPRYKPDGLGISTVRAAYGPRLRDENRDQIHWVVDLLKAKPTTRRAVIPIYAVQDTSTDLPEVPCTCTLQFFLRRNRLEMITHMRSNDAYLGLPSDVFAFTMIQEIVARALDVEIGIYRHLIGNLHLYTRDMHKAQSFVDSGWQRKRSMPSLPLGDPFENLKEVLRLEHAIRSSGDLKPPNSLPEFWKDIVQLLRVYRAHSLGESSRRIGSLCRGIHSEVYKPYIDTKLQKAEEREQKRMNMLVKPLSLFEQEDGM